MGKNIKKAAGKEVKTKVSGKKKIIYIGATVLVLAGVIAGIIITRPKKAPEVTQMSQNDALKYAASKDFAALPVAEKQRFAEEMRKSGNPREMFRNNNLSDAEKEQLRNNMRAMFRLRMEEQAKKLLAMTKEERQKEYDRMADEMKQRMANRQGGFGGPGGPGGPGGRGPGGPGGQNIARMQERYEGMSSDSRAILAEMRKEIHKRLQNK